jgi:hypothetical protein
MGTLQNGVEQVFRLVAEPCAGLPIQPVISLGGGLSEESPGPSGTACAATRTS